MELSLRSAKLKLPLSGPSHHHRCPGARWTGAKLDGTTVRFVGYLVGLKNFERKHFPEKIENKKI